MREVENAERVVEVAKHYDEPDNGVWQYLAYYGYARVVVSALH